MLFTTAIGAALGDWQTSPFGLAIRTFNEPQHQIIAFEGRDRLVGIYRRSEWDYRNQRIRRLGPRWLSSLVPSHTE